MKLFSVLGTAGAGKTTTLTDLLSYLKFSKSNLFDWEQYFDSVDDLSKIAFISFSNNAIYEIAKRFNISVKARQGEEGRYFRTSTGLFEVLLYENNLLTREEMKSINKLEYFRSKWAREHGLYYKINEVDFSLTGNAFFTEYSYLINTLYNKLALDEIVEKHSKSLLLKQYILEKQEKKIIDYEDILMRTYDNADNIVFDVDLIIIDEAQDNSILEYLTLLKIAKNNNIDILLAGDDAQLIYNFKGASYKLFYKLINKSKIILNLNKSFRFGENIARLATNVLNDMQFVQKRDILYNEDINSRVSFIDTNTMLKILTSNMFKNKTIYILTRTNSILNNVSKLLDLNNIVHEKNSTVNDYDKFILSLRRLLNNEHSRRDIDVIIEFIKEKTHKDVSKLLLQHKFKFTEDDIFELLFNANFKHSDIEKIMKNITQQNNRIKLSTIHAVKGSESDVVFLINSVNYKTKTKLDYESEKRVLFTAITRAREHLFIVDDLFFRKTTQLYYFSPYIN